MAAEGHWVGKLEPQDCSQPCLASKAESFPSTKRCCFPHCLGGWEAQWRYDWAGKHTKETTSWAGKNLSWGPGG